MNKYWQHKPLINKAYATEAINTISEAQKELNSLTAYNNFQLVCKYGIKLAKQVIK